MRHRLIFLGIATVALVLLLVVVPFARVGASYRMLTQAADEAAVAATAASGAAPLLAGGLDTALAELVRNSSTPTRELFVLDATGAIRATSGPQLGDLSASEKVEVLRIAKGLLPRGIAREVFPLRPIVAVEPIRNGQQTIGAVVTAGNPGPVRHKILRDWLFLAMRSMLITAIAALFALPITRLTIRPLIRLGEAMRDVVTGDETNRVPVNEGPEEIRVLAGSFNRMADEMQHALQRQRSFVADASHQLRTPLTALSLRVERIGLEIARLDSPPSDLVREHGEATRDLEGMITIVEQLLVLARAERSVETGAESPVSVVAARLTAWTLLGRNRGVTIQSNLPGPDADVIVQVGALGQVLDVLVDNAVKFSAPGAIVQIAGQLRADFYELTVQNDIDPIRPHPAGFGLGLDIATRLVVAVGGTLTLALHETTSVATVRLVRVETAVNIS